MNISVENIRPLHKYLLISPLDYRPSESKGGLIIPEAKNNPTPVLGTVISAGTGCEIKKGDIVFFRRFSVDDLKFNVDGNQQTVSLIEESEVVAVIESKNGTN